MIRMIFTSWDDANVERTIGCSMYVFDSIDEALERIGLMVKIAFESGKRYTIQVID